MARFISIISSSPGAGKTTVALNLGLALHNLKQKVVVLDADFSKPNMLSHLDMEGIPITLEDVFSGKHKITDSIYKHVSGLRLIPSMTMKEYSKLKDHLTDFLSEYDFIILDTPTDHEDLIEVLKNCTEAIIVHSPEFSSKAVLDASTMLSTLNITNLGVILNKSHSGSVDSIFDVPVIAKFSDHEHIRKSFSLRHPVVHTHPSSSSSKEFLTLAKKLVS